MLSYIVLIDHCHQTGTEHTLLVLQAQERQVKISLQRREEISDVLISKRTLTKAELNYIVLVELM